MTNHKRTVFLERLKHWRTRLESNWREGMRADESYIALKFPLGALDTVSNGNKGDKYLTNWLNTTHAKECADETCGCQVKNRPMLEAKLRREREEGVSAPLII